MKEIKEGLDDAEAEGSAEGEQGGDATLYQMRVP
jgi:hypothetical protein